MKTILIILLATSLAYAGTPDQAERLSPRITARNGVVNFTANKRADVVRVVPHLAAGTTWKSQLIFRNDLDVPVDLGMDLYGADGFPASVIFYDSDGTQFESDRFDFTLQPFEIYTVEFDLMSNENLDNFQAFIFSDETQQEFSVEAIFDNFQGIAKVATVGGGIQVPGDNFFMNVDRRLDPYTNNPKLRGLAVTNIETDTCTCDVIMWDNLGNQVANSELILAPLEKFVGTVSSVFNGTDNLNSGLGLVDFNCDNLVGVTGLAFETGTPIVGSTPIDYYVFNAGKKQRRGR